MPVDLATPPNSLSNTFDARFQQNIFNTKHMYLLLGKPFMSGRQILTSEVDPGTEIEKYL